MRVRDAQYFLFPTVSVTEWQFVSPAAGEAPVAMSITRNIVEPYDAQTDKYNFTTPVLVTDTYYVTNSTVVPPFSTLTGPELQRMIYEIRSIELNFAYINVAAGSFGDHDGVAARGAGGFSRGAARAS